MKQPRIKSKCLKAIINGEIVPCGSGFYMTADGSWFLGKPSEAVMNEMQHLLSNVKLPTTLKVNIQNAYRYSGGAL